MYPKKVSSKKITFSINVYWCPKSQALARISREFPFVLSLLDRLPSALRRKLVCEAVSINERIVEHPWVFLNIGVRTGRVLDVGCCWSPLPIELASLGFEVWGIDIARPGLSHPNFRFVQEDICQSTLPDGFFDRVLAISTIEHIGLGHYGESVGEGKDQQAVMEIYRLLKVRGKAMISVPFGKRRVTPIFRVYDSNAFKNLVSQFKVKKTQWFIQRGETWLASSEQEASLQDLVDRGRPTAVVLIVGG